MNRSHLKLIFAVAAVVAGAAMVIGVSGSGATAQESIWPNECSSGQLGAQIILTCLPPAPVFNGDLVIYAHGYVAPQAELALPEAEFGPFVDIIPLLLSQGFAFATTSYSVNGYAVEQAGNDIEALAGHVSTLIDVERVFLVGASEGGIIATMLAELNPGLFDGALAMCGPLGGMPYQIEYVGDFRVVFDYFFPGVFPFGMADVPPDAYLDWESRYLPGIADAVRSHRLKAAQLFNIAGVAVDVFHPETFVEAAETLLFYNIWGTPDMIAKAGGMPYDNQNARYPASWWLNRRVERVEGDPVAAQYLVDYYQPTGDLTVPVAALHTLWDPAVPYRHEEIYRDRVAAMGRAENFTLLPVFAYGHCNFKPWQVLGAFYLLLAQAGP